MRKLLLLGVVVMALAAPTVACTGGDDDDDDDDGVTAEVSGTVQVDDVGGDTPGAGATVSEAGNASNSVTADGTGAYTITIPADEPVFLRATGAGLFGSQRGLVVTSAGTTGFQLSGPAATLVAAVEAGLAVTLDDTKGILALNFGGTAVTSAGGIAATINLTADGSFTFNSSGNPTLSTATLPNGQENLIFYNVDVGTTTLSIDLPGAGSCTEPAGITTFRVDANVITEVGMDCN